jgi:hypothetical protein
MSKVWQTEKEREDDNVRKVIIRVTTHRPLSCYSNPLEKYFYSAFRYLVWRHSALLPAL